jgi:hypothetical protein
VGLLNPEDVNEGSDAAEIDEGSGDSNECKAGEINYRGASLIFGVCDRLFCMYIILFQETSSSSHVDDGPLRTDRSRSALRETLKSGHQASLRSTRHTPSYIL